MKLNLEELHYISIIVDSIVDTEELMSNSTLNRREVNSFVKEWIKYYKKKNDIEVMRKNDFLQISNQCIEEYHQKNFRKK